MSIANILADLLKAQKRRVMYHYGLYALPFLPCLAFLLLHFQVALSSALLFTVLVLALFLFILSTSRRYKALCVEGIVLHLNRHYDDLQESSQLLLEDIPTGTLKSLQKQRIERRFIDHFNAHQFNGCWPKLPIKRTIGLSLLLLVFTVFLLNFDKGMILGGPKGLQIAPKIQSPISSQQDVVLNQSTVIINPPDYSKMQDVHQQLLNIELLAGSSVTWKLHFNQTEQPYYLLFNNGESLALSKDTISSEFIGRMTISKSRIYRIAYGEHKTPLKGMYVISANRDKAPIIKVISPKKMSNEYAKDTLPVVKAQVEISDDYGLSNINILASVAKGSGESVKFRDQEFNFDTQQPLINQQHGFSLEKTWDLSMLGMEPGDELYFTVIASDNRTQNAQQSRSATYRLKWLEETQAGLASEGIVVFFNPDYFRSQRQIIIETEQLIADKPTLSSTNFKETSSDLGHSQQDLKLRFGQYLGDENEAQEGSSFYQAHQEEGKTHNGAGETDKDTDHEEHAQTHVKAKQASTGLAEHSHKEHTKKEQTSGGLTSLASVIEKFGHDHGDPEIGPISKRNPVGLMKRSLTNMWQAELHLMLAEPEKALPYEKAAYKYLKLAKQAERIYTKRLGFEPPPVTEDRRLTGELNDINSKDHNGFAKPLPTQEQAFIQKAYLAINQIQLTHRLRERDKSTIKQLSDTLLAYSEKDVDRQAIFLKQSLFIEQLLTLESGQRINSTVKLKKLQALLWELINDSPVKAHQQKSFINANQELYKEFMNNVTNIAGDD